MFWVHTSLERYIESIIESRRYYNYTNSNQKNIRVKSSEKEINITTQHNSVKTN